MKIKHLVMLALVAMTLGTKVQAASGKVLVVLSSESKLTLRGGLKHPTGFFLSELGVPLRAIVNAGYEPVFADPQGNKPSMDYLSDQARWFGGDPQRLRSMKEFLSGFEELRHPRRLVDVRRGDLGGYAGIFVPGGHAPMEDLVADADLGAILRYFHETAKPTALICHGPVALLATLPSPISFLSALASNTPVTPVAWIYQGYRITSFSTAEERQEEPGEDNALGGYVRFYPDQALEEAGARLETAGKWQSHVVRDRELITGQNPMSDSALAEVFLRALEER